MASLENRPSTALLVVDVQNGVVEGAHASAARTNRPPTRPPHHQLEQRP